MTQVRNIDDIYLYSILHTTDKMLTLEYLVALVWLKTHIIFRLKGKQSSYSVLVVIMLQPVHVFEGVAADRWSIQSEGRFIDQMSVQSMISCGTVESCDTGGKLEDAWYYLQNKGYGRV